MVLLPPAVVLLLSHALEADLSGLGAIVGHGGLAEPRVVEGLARRYPLGRVVDEDLLEEVQEQPQEAARRRDDVLGRSAAATSEEGDGSTVRTDNLFMFLTNFREALVVSTVG